MRKSNKSFGVKTMTLKMVKCSIGLRGTSLVIIFFVGLSLQVTQFTDNHLTRFTYKTHYLYTISNNIDYYIFNLFDELDAVLI